MQDFVNAAGCTQGHMKWFISPKLELTTDAEYDANLVNVNKWLQTCNSAVYYMDTDDISLTDITGSDWLKF